MKRDAARQSRPKLEEKIRGELQEWLLISGYLAFFFLSFEVYRHLVLREEGLAAFRYGFAFVEALVVGKFILIGKAMHLGERHTSQTLFVRTLWMALAYGLLILALSVLERLLEGLIRGTGLVAVLREIGSLGLYEPLARSLVMFVTLLPLFALYSLARKMGRDRLWPLFFRRTA